MKPTVFIILIILLTACGNTKTYTEQEQQAFQNVKDMATAKNFEIESNVASPRTTSAFNQVANSGILGPGNSSNTINLIGNPNNLTIKGDSISGYFPFFGEQQLGAGHPGSTHQGITFNDNPKDYKMTVNDPKHIITINFSIDDQFRNNERYNVLITLFQNKRSSIQINSTKRSSIEYSGSARALKEDKIIKN